LQPFARIHQYFFRINFTNTITSLTSITYLNEDFDGGRSVMYDGTKIKPKTGRTLIFDGNKYIHGVEPILKGERYTLPIWYKNTIRELI
jgi:predicted 2-oxoglutarate/Fe(II)-dependent dioxygenase YbiX